MRVLDEHLRGVRPDEQLDLQGAGLPRATGRAALIVFWKAR